jgi:DNA helicase HerA-like ATPase
MAKPMLMAKNSVGTEFYLLSRMANRHGLIAGATGTGKTVSLQRMAESLSENGVAVFMADVKGDLSGISQKGNENPKIVDRLKLLQMDEHAFQSFPVAFWDVFGKSGHPVRTTVSDMGPLLMGRLLNLNDVQTGVLTLVFKIADDNGLLLLDLKDLRSMARFVGDNSQEFTTTYGNISKASIGAIQRGLLELETQGGDQFFGEPMLDIFDLIQTNSDGRGMINILAADQLISRPKVYATFLLWLLAELFERLPEAGDLEKPKLVFFFDEAHLLFEDIPEALLEKIEQVVRLIRSKGVGVYFVTQNPRDVPEKVLAQLGNRVQHALRAFTPQEQKAVKIMAQTFRPNPKIDIEQDITQLAVGEALVSFLEESGTPAIVERVFICPPKSRIGAITSDEKQSIITSSIHYGNYEKAIDRESAYEVIKKRTEQKLAQQNQQTQQSSQNQSTFAEKYPTNPPVQPQYREPAMRRSPGRPRDSMAEAFAKSAARSIGSTVGRQIIRGVLGSILGGRK